MAESKTLTQRLEDAMQQHFGDNGGGFVTGFVAAVDYVDSDGASVMYICSMPGQGTYKSMGLSEYLKLWYADDAQSAWTGLARANCECDDHDEDDD